jgi:hypothetical protein
MSNLSLLFIFLSELNRKEVDVITIPDKETTVVIILYYALTRVVRGSRWGGGGGGGDSENQ